MLYVDYRQKTIHLYLLRPTSHQCLTSLTKPISQLCVSLLNRIWQLLFDLSNDIFLLLFIYHNIIYYE